MINFDFNKLKGKPISEVINLANNLAKNKDSLETAQQLYKLCIDKYKIVPGCSESKNRGKIRHLLWNSTGNINRRYKSQSGQDEFIFKNFFNKKKNGFFVDIGAHDGITGSNTYFFEKELNWDGVCIEPNNSIYKHLIQNRSVKSFNFGISDTNGKKEFINITHGYHQMSSFKSTFEHFDNKKILDNSKYSIENITTKNINSFFYEEKIDKVDFLSIDTEGHEEIILKELNFDLIKINVICVENNSSNLKLDKILKSKFSFFDYVGMDEIWINSTYI